MMTTLMSKFESHDQMAGGVSDRVDSDQEYRMEGHKQTLLRINNEALTEVRSCSIALCEVIATQADMLAGQKSRHRPHACQKRNSQVCILAACGTGMYSPCTQPQGCLWVIQRSRKFCPEFPSTTPTLDNAVWILSSSLFRKPH